MGAPWEKYQQPITSGGPWEKYAQQSSAPGEDPSTLEALGRGTLQGATLGYGDEAYGALSAGMDKLGGSSEDYSSLYDAARDKMRGDNERAAKAHPYAYGAGNLAGGVATGIATGGTGLVGAAALGGAAGLGYSDAKDLSGMAKDTAIGTGLGILGHGFASMVSGNLPQTAENLYARSLNASKSKYFNPEELRDAARIGLDNKIGINPLNGPRAVSNQANELVDSLGAQKGKIIAGGGDIDYNAAIEKARNGLRQQPAYGTSDVAGINRAFQELDQGQAQISKNMLSREPLGDETMALNQSPLSELDNVKMSLQRIPDYKADPGAVTAKPYMRQAADSVRQTIEERVPEVGPVNQQYQNALGLQNLADNAAASYEHRPFSVYGAGAGYAAGGPVGGAAGALLAKPAAASGLRVAAYSVDALGKILQTNPEMLGSYQAPLKSALQRGPQAFQATVHVLNQDPSFRAHMSKTGN